MLIHPVGESNLIEELKKVASIANQEYEAMIVSNSKSGEYKVNNFICVNLKKMKAWSDIFVVEVGLV